MSFITHRTPQHGLRAQNRAADLLHFQLPGPSSESWRASFLEACLSPDEIRIHWGLVGLPDEMQIKINQFVVDVCRLMCQLDEVGRRDHPDIRRAAAEKGQAAYEELLERQHALALTPEDNRMIQTMLSGISGRLKFLF